MQGKQIGWPRLHQLAADGNIAELRQELASGADPNIQRGDRTTALHVALTHAVAPEIAVALIDAGADPNAELGTELASDYTTPLAVAAASGRDAVVDALIAAGAQPNDDRGDNSPLEVALISGHVSTAATLLAAGADPNGRVGYPPLHLAAQMSAAMVEVLLLRGADANIVNDGQTALHCVVEDMPADAARIVDLLLKNGASQRGPGGEHEVPPLQQALAQDDPNLACINRLLSDAVEQMDDWPGGLDGLDDSWTPLHAAASNPEVPRGVVDALVGFGCDPDVEGRDGTPLMVAATAGALTPIKELLNRGVSANGDDDDQRPLTCAIEGGSVAAVAALVNAGATVDSYEHIELALEHAFRPNRPTSSQQTPTSRKGSPAWDLTWSSPTEEDAEMVRLLVAATVEGGEIPTLLGNLGERLAGATPLHWVAAFGSRQLAERCVRTRAHARLADTEGWSPLHWAACCNESTSVLQWLLATGADPTATTRDGRTALEIAQVAQNGAAQQCLARSRGRPTPGPRGKPRRRAVPARKPRR